VQVIEVRCEAKPLDGPLNVRFDMGGRVTDASSGSKDFKTAL
jgi:hypothetical protein